LLKFLDYTQLATHTHTR